jgi:hypothetical protein
MPDTSFEPAIADVGRYPAFSEDDVHSLSSGTAGTLYPALKARVGLMLTFDRSRVTLAASATWLAGSVALSRRRRGRMRLV